MALKILLVEDDEVDRIAVRRALQHAGLEVELTEAETCRDAERRLRENGGFDCAFIDYRLPDGDGLALLQRIGDEDVSVPVIMLTGQGDELLAVEALKSGAVDYLPKAYLSPDRLRSCLRSVENVRHRDAEEAQAREEARERLQGLTARERQVVEGLVAGKANKTVAAELGISCRTVESHRARIMRKTQCRSLADLVQLVMRAGSAG